MERLCRALPQAFRLPAPSFTEKNLPDQTGKVMLVTGGNIGLGYEVISILYSKNAKVYMATRSDEKARAAISSIKAKYPDSKGELIYLPLDLADLTTIKKSADTFLANETRLDWLCNQAGVMFPPAGSKTAQGYELQVGTNILGPFLFTKLLTPILKKTAESNADTKGSVRVSWAASSAAELGATGGIQFKDDGSPIEGRSVYSAYAVTKTANWWLAYESGKRYGNRDGVLHNAFNPGNLITGLQRHSRDSGIGPYMYRLFDLFLYPAILGAYTELFCGFSPELKFPENQGAYVIPWGRIDTENVRRDVRENMGPGKGSEMLWNWCEGEVHKYLV